MCDGDHGRWGNRGKCRAVGRLTTAEMLQGRAREAVSEKDWFQGLSPPSKAQRDQHQQRTVDWQKLASFSFLKNILFKYQEPSLSLANCSQEK